MLHHVDGVCTHGWCVFCFMEVSICLVGDTSTLFLLLLSHNGDHFLISRLHVLAMLLLLFFIYLIAHVCDAKVQMHIQHAYICGHTFVIAHVCT